MDDQIYHEHRAWRAKSSNEGWKKRIHKQPVSDQTNHLKHILDIVVWIPNFSMPDFSFVGAVWSKPHWEDKNMLEPYF